MNHITVDLECENLISNCLAKVIAISEDSSAQSSGLRVNDVILKLIAKNGQSFNIDSQESFMSFVRSDEFKNSVILQIFAVNHFYQCKNYSLDFK